MIQQPINLRNDFFQIYLNVLEQISPLVAKDSYNIISKDGKRILNKNGGKFKGRSLTNELVDKELTAQELDNGDMSLSQKFETTKKPSETSNQSTNYEQSSTIQNGSLLESKVKSGFSMSDDKSLDNSQDQNGMPLLKKIEIKSEGLLRFVRQEDTINDSLYNTIIEYQNDMSVIDQNHQQALILYNSVFNTNDNKGDSYIDKDLQKQGESETGRILADSGKDMYPPVSYPIFRKSFASIQFGADVRSECKQFSGGASKDICKIGLYSYFNGDIGKIAEKETRINVSKILKYYQLIQNLSQTKLNVIKVNVLNQLKNIQSSLEGILNKVEEAIDAKRNPILKEVQQIILNDEIQVFTHINTFEQLLNRDASNISNFFEDPFQAISESTFSFITLKKINIEKAANQIQNFYISKLNFIKMNVNSQQSINQEDYDDIKKIIENIDDMISILIDQPVKNIFDILERHVQESSNKVYDQANIIEKSVIIPKDDSKIDKNISNNEDANQQKQSNFLKKILGTSAIVQTLQNYLLKIMTNISKVQDFSEMVTSNLKKTVKKIAIELLEDIEKLPKQSSQRSDTIRNSLDEFENIFDHSLDLTVGLVQVKDQIDENFKTVTIIQQKYISKIVENVARSITGFPAELISKLKSQGQVTIEKYKNAAINMNQNLIQWKNEIALHSKKLLSDAINLYDDLKKQLSQVGSIGDDPDMYKKPLFNEFEDLAGSVNQVVKQNAGGVTEIAKRFNNIQNKFQVFLSDTKGLSENTFNYFKDIDISISGIQIDQKQIWSNINQKPQSQAAINIKQLQSIYENDINKSINLQTFPDLSKQVSTLANNDLIEFQNIILENNKILSQKVKTLLQETIKQAEFEGREGTPQFSLPFEFTMYFPTPIGILLKMRLYTSWDSQLFFEFKFKNAVLDLSVGVKTKVTVGGEVSASVIVAEVGGYAEGTFLNTSIKLGLILKALENFKGSLYLDADFQPFEIKMGLYYKTIFTFSIRECFRRQLWFGWIRKAFKAVVRAVVNTVKFVVKVVKKVIQWFQRQDIFSPLVISGNVYKAKLLQYDF